jgi:hypothetical protein
MSTLQSEWDRLYRANSADKPASALETPGLIAQGGRVRAMVLELARPADWSALASVWRGVQTDLELPAPAIAVSGVDAYQLWFSLEEPVAVSEAQAFLESLRLRYLGSIAPGRIRLMPAEGGSSDASPRHASAVPALHKAAGRWSAFVAPDLAAIFSEEPWLDIAPGPEAQASVLVRLECIKPALFQAIVAQIKRAPGAAVSLSEGVAETAVQGKDLEPRRFLQDVLNDESAALHLRIEAAKALLH